MVMFFTVAATVFFIFVILSVSAVVLSTACSFVRVQPPEFFSAMLIIVLLGIVGAVINIVAGTAATYLAGVSLDSLRTTADYKALVERGQMTTMVLSPFFSAGIFSVMLQDCSFRRGLFVWLAQFAAMAALILGIWTITGTLGLTGTWF
jgi:hypothetical protein